MAPNYSIREQCTIGNFILKIHRTTSPTSRRTDPVWCPSVDGKTPIDLGLEAQRPGLVRSQTGMFLGFHMKIATALRSLGAIKETSRRLQPVPKHFKSTSTLLNSVTTHSNDLSEIQASFEL